RRPARPRPSGPRFPACTPSLPSAPSLPQRAAAHPAQCRLLAPGVELRQHGIGEINAAVEHDLAVNDHGYPLALGHPGDRPIDSRQLLVDELLLVPVELRLVLVKEV